MGMIAMMYFQSTWANDTCKNGEVCSINYTKIWVDEGSLFFF